MMADIEMERMKKLPIQKLSYDLKLELLDNMDPRDVIELVNVNRGFRSIVVGEPWRILGKHVDLIEISASDLNSHRIRKCKSWIRYSHQKITLEGSPTYSMNLKTYSTLISKIRSTQLLELYFSYVDEIWEEDLRQRKRVERSAELLSSLNSVNELFISIDDHVQDVHGIKKCLTILALNQIKKAIFWIPRAEMDEKILEFLSNFVVTRLNHCKSIEINEVDRWGAPCRRVDFWYQIFSKIWTELILIGISDFEELVHRIVTHGIPASNPEAAILVWDSMRDKCAHNLITGLLSQTPGIHRIDEEELGGVEAILEKWDLDELLPKIYVGSSDRFKLQGLLREGVYFTRSIDSNRKCIYVTMPDYKLFFAKYIIIG